MKNHLLQFLALLFISYPILGQHQDSVPTIEEANASYFQVPRETLYLHVNKSTYIAGEEIWFKGYVYDRQNNLPSIISTNFEVEVFDQEGNEVFDGVFLGNKGSFQGNIQIDSTWNSGAYYIRASTHWMHNFVENESYTKKINIIKDTLLPVTNNKDRQYDFQLLPEGGHVVSNTFNTIGFKLINNQGYGVAFDQGVIQDESGNEVTTFSSNAVGIGKFNITPIPEKQYRALIRLKDGSEIERSFPKIEKKGISVSVNNLLEDQVAMQFNTNTATIKELQQDKYTLVIRKNHLSKKMKIYFGIDELKKTILIKRSGLYAGVNTITLFKDNDPLVERVLYNPVDTSVKNIDIKLTSVERDSLSVALRIPYNASKTYDISVSTLPSGTLSYNHSDNIQSAIMLRPYVKGYIENEKRYFKALDREKVYDLDLLLITQGWSKYKWENIFKSKPDVSYNFNQGFKITGKIQDKKRKQVDKIYFFPTVNNEAKLVEVNNNTFEIDNFFPEKGEKLKVSGVNAKGDFKKYKVYLQVQSERIHKSFLNTFPEAERRFTQKAENKTTVPFDFLANVQELDAVEIKGSTQKEIENTSRITIPKYFALNSKKITLEKAEQYFSILDYIASTRKFRVINQSPVDIAIVPISVIALGLPSLNSGSGQLETSEAKVVEQPMPVAVYLDDILLSDLGILWDYRTQDVDRIYMDKTSYAAGSRGGRGGSIRIYSRRFPLVRTRTTDKEYLEYELEKGFEPVKEFYNPGYSNYLDPFFVSYGAIDWQPKLNFNELGVATFKIPNTGIENITLFIEGMDNDGNLISKTHNIKKIIPN
ncbi:hypothetical protein [Aquimarina sp. AU474]|uniref:hypothetical protein n=1 Tax=Aquimarina sp. AU474 TaxID=2108529 RepID=UPI000D6929D9|nr:hypothetical protein [Aquimarina sp. AU474]